MNKLTLTTAALAAIALVGFDSSSATASHGYSNFGLSIGGRNLSLNIGSETAGHPLARYRGAYGRHDAYSAYRASNAYRALYGSRYAYNWRGAGHYDYVPGHYLPHGNHFDYVPGRYVWHRGGHYDRPSCDRGRPPHRGHR